MKTHLFIDKKRFLIKKKNFTWLNVPILLQKLFDYFSLNTFAGFKYLKVPSKVCRLMKRNVELPNNQLMRKLMEVEPSFNLLEFENQITVEPIIHAIHDFISKCTIEEFYRGFNQFSPSSFVAPQYQFSGEHSWKCLNVLEGIHVGYGKQESIEKAAFHVQSEIKEEDSDWR